MMWKSSRILQEKHTPANTAYNALSNILYEALRMRVIYTYMWKLNKIMCKTIHH